MTTATSSPTAINRWPRSRWQAGLTHLLLSALIGGLLLLLIRFVWYPGLLFDISGGSELAMLVIGIDVVLGPLLTTVVFVRGKKNLWLDLTLIGLLQAAAFIYGSYVTLVARPAFMVGAIDRIQVIGANEFEPENWAEASAEAKLSWTGPVWVGVEMPADPKLREDITFGRVGGGADLPLLPRFYQSYDEVKANLRARALGFDELSGSDRDAVLRQLAEQGQATDGLAWVPLVGRIGSAIMVLDRQGSPLGAYQANPWNRSPVKGGEANGTD